MASDFYFIESSQMKAPTYSLQFLLCSLLAGCCTLECIAPLTPAKAYGEYWIKPGMTTESWRQDWVACGGRKDGGYSAGTRLSEEKDDFAASRRKTKQLSGCMQEKGYAYHYGNPPAK
jgi:hypothetical protein